MTIISPSLLAADFTNISTELSYIDSEKDIWLHLDVMDGHFVPNLTFGIPIIKQISNTTNIPLDVHLMVTNPDFIIGELKGLNIHNITFHLEAVSNSLELIKKYRTDYTSIGISIRPNTSVSEIDLSILKNVDLVLVMSVEPGFGGQSFMPNSLDKIEELVSIRSKNSLKFKIQIDGGINSETAKLAKEVGADNLVAGSYIFKQDQINYSKQIDSLR